MVNYGLFSSLFSVFPCGSSWNRRQNFSFFFVLFFLGFSQRLWWNSREKHVFLVVMRYAGKNMIFLNSFLKPTENVLFSQRSKRFSDSPTPGKVFLTPDGAMVGLSLSGSQENLGVFLWLSRRFWQSVKVIFLVVWDNFCIYIWLFCWYIVGDDYQVSS